MNCLICNKKDIPFSFTYNGPDEFLQKIQAAPDFERKWYHCSGCDTLCGSEVPGIEELYKEEYYQNGGGENSIEKRFESIISLPEDQSDNRQRVKRVKQDFSEISRVLNPGKGSDTLSEQNSPLKVLDVGSGIGVFLAAFLDDQWEGTGLEPDRNACEFLEEKTKAKAVCGYLGQVQLEGKFDLITLNRVLEHSNQPLELMKSLHANLHKNSIVYLELPDMKSLEKYGTECDQFNCTHFFAVSPKSIKALAERSSFNVKKTNSVLEPSGKITCYSFLTKKGLNK